MGCWYRRGGVVLLLGAMVAVVGCRAGRDCGRTIGTSSVSTEVVRGAAFYGAYCAGCHGDDGGERGPVARSLSLDPPDLGADGLLADATDAEIVARLRSGAPLPMSSRHDPFLEETAVHQLEAYLATLDGTDWTLLRTGRLVFEEDCASCHGVFGDGDSIYPALPQAPPPDLAVARERYTDEALAVVSVEGKGAMPRLVGGFEPMEMRALVAYVRYLSPGYRLYDTYCAACHGEGGQGVHPEDALAPAIAAPALTAAGLARLTPDERRAKVLHMLEREQGVMPHFRGIVDDDKLHDIVAYLRSWEQ